MDYLDGKIGDRIKLSLGTKKYNGQTVTLSEGPPPGNNVPGYRYICVKFTVRDKQQNKSDRYVHLFFYDDNKVSGSLSTSPKRTRPTQTSGLKGSWLAVMSVTRTNIVYFSQRKKDKKFTIALAK